MADALTANGVLRGDRVLVLAPPPSRADLVALLLALERAGAVLVWADPAAIGYTTWLREMAALEPRWAIASMPVWAIFCAAVRVVRAEGMLGGCALARTHRLPSHVPSPRALADAVSDAEASRAGDARACQTESLAR